MSAELNDLTICEVVSALYHEQAVGYWDHFWPIDGSYSAHKKIGEIDLLVWRGSITSADWLQDLKSYPTASLLGRVHAGFLTGVRGNASRMDSVCGDNVVLCGHSLGAGHAVLHAGLRRYYKRPVKRVVLFGEPRSGDHYLQWLLRGIPISSYRNNHDPVCDVPEWLLHAREPLIQLSVAPKFGDLGILTDHHMVNYYEGLKGLFSGKQTLSTHPYLGSS